MATNGRALLAATIAGLMVVGVTYWWKHHDDKPDAPRAGCTTAVVAVRWACSILLLAIPLAIESEYCPADSNPTPGTRLASSPSQTSR